MVYKWIASILLVAALSGLLVERFVCNSKTCDEELRFLSKQPSGVLKSFTITTDSPAPGWPLTLMLSRDGEMRDTATVCSDLALREVLEAWGQLSKGQLKVYLTITAKEKPTISTIERAVNRLVAATPEGMTLTVVVHVF